jgi:aspartyl-tRNA(Asn)/glutamyl-tRNA(Gln) amidotransferase subunit A
MILTKEIPTTAGSKMLNGYVSLFEAEVLTRLFANGYALAGKASVGEFAIDLLGETAFQGAELSDGKLTNATAEILKAGEAMAAITLDVNGSVRRAAAQSGLVSVKPTYGTVSRYGTVPVACSGETVSVMASTAADCETILDVIAGHDDKDGTSLSDALCAQLKKDATVAPVRRVAILADMKKGIDAEVEKKLTAARASLEENGIEVVEIENSVIAAARVAWNILMSAELCNNVSRYDGVKYGYRTEHFTNLDELYTNSRTEAFGELLKTAILFGSETLSTENYMKVYDKALRTRRVIVESFAKIFERVDAVLIPATSSMAYTEAQATENKYLAFEENFYTAPASVTGLPAVVAGGVQLIGKAFSDRALLKVAKVLEKEGK